jgi:hypothetical protein
MGDGSHCGAKRSDIRVDLIEAIVASRLLQQSLRVRLGTSIIILPQREPILLAKQLAAIDLSLEVGSYSGGGWLEEEFGLLKRATGEEN